MSSPPREIRVQQVGDSIKLNCSARGLPLPKVKWLKDGRVVSTEAHKENDLIKSEFIIYRFESSDTGIYTCLFENDKNGAARNSTTLCM